MAELTTLPSSVSADDICEILDRDAGVIVKDVLDANQLARIQSELGPYLSQTADGTNDFTGHQTKRIGALIARSEMCRELALDPVVNGTCAQFLEPYAKGYQLHFTQAISIGPGETAQPLHRDRGLWGGQIPRRIETQLSTIWAITPFTKENGATLVVPGSHKWDKDREAKPHEIAYAEMSPGSVLIYTGTVIHGGGANATQDRRLGVLIHYALNWLRQEENQYLSCPPDIAATLSPKLRELIGYSQGGPLLGFYSTPGAPGQGVELADPGTLFE